MQGHGYKGQCNIAQSVESDMQHIRVCGKALELIRVDQRYAEPSAQGHTLTPSDWGASTQAEPKSGQLRILSVPWDPWAPSPSSAQPHSCALSNFQSCPTLVTSWPTTHQPPETLVIAPGWVPLGTLLALLCSPKVPQSSVKTPLTFFPFWVIQPCTPTSGA